MKKFLAVVMALVMLMTFGVVSFAGGNDTQLQFKDGKFKILCFADVQDGYPLYDDVIVFMNEAIEKTNPDLVIFLGDNVMGADTEENYWLGYDQMLAPCVDHGVPFTFVFGNHDDESMPTISKEQMLEKYQSYEGCLAYDADPALHGCATHNLEILSSDGSHTAYNLWLMDSGDYATTENGRHYDCVRADQIEWYETTSKALEAKGGKLVPSMMFQHIVPAEVAQQIMVTLPFHIGKLGKYDMEDGTAVTYLPNIFGFESGLVGEAPCPSTENEGQWDSLVARGDVKAMFFGHDHVNTYKANVKGVDAMNVPGATYSSYSSYIHQGAVLISLDESNLDTYETEILYTNVLALEDGSQLPGLERTKASYGFSRFLSVFLQVLLTPFKMLANVFGKIIY